MINEANKTRHTNRPSYLLVMELFFTIVRYRVTDIRFPNHIEAQTLNCLIKASIWQRVVSGLVMWSPSQVIAFIMFDIEKTASDKVK